MATRTTNLSLVKPDYADNADIAVINANMDTLDTVIAKNDFVGEVKVFAGNTLPSGWLLCDGSLVSRDDYADLFTVIGTTYGVGDGSTTFALPDLVDKFIEGSATAGTEKSAGLPNITGRQQYTTNNGGYLNAFGSGAFYTYTSTSGSIVTSSGSTTVDRIDFDASKSNSIYGNSTTVQPPALTMRYIIKY